MAMAFLLHVASRSLYVVLGWLVLFALHDDGDGVGGGRKRVY